MGGEHFFPKYLIVQRTKTLHTDFLAAFKAKLKDYSVLVKLRLSLLVVFSSAMGFLLATNGVLVFTELLTLCLGGFLVTGASILSLI